jgi:hypothetical protein
VHLRRLARSAGEMNFSRQLWPSAIAIRRTMGKRGQELNSHCPVSQQHSGRVVHAAHLDASRSPRRKMSLASRHEPDQPRACVECATSPPLPTLALNRPTSPTCLTTFSAWLARSWASAGPPSKTCFRLFGTRHPNWRSVEGSTVGRTGLRWSKWWCRV